MSVISLLFVLCSQRSLLSHGSSDSDGASSDGESERIVIKHWRDPWEPYFEESPETLAALIEMMKSVESLHPAVNRIKTSIADCIQSGDCSMKGIGEAFGKEFSFRNGRLTAIYLQKHGLFARFNLATIPQPVTFLDLKHNKLISIGDLRDLRGSCVETLQLTSRHRGLDIDLDPLQNTEDPLPLKALSVSAHQIEKYFGLYGIRDLTSAIKEWKRTSSLERLTVMPSYNNGQVVF